MDPFSVIGHTVSRRTGPSGRLPFADADFICKRWLSKSQFIRESSVLGPATKGLHALRIHNNLPVPSGGSPLKDPTGERSCKSTSSRAERTQLMKHIFTVSELTRNIQLLLESSFDRIWIEGEISNLRRPGSGHVYFTLKDERSQIRAVVFRQALRAVRFALEDGMHIICRAAVNVYEQRGEYQLIIDLVEPQGIGALQVAFEQLKARLQAEGLFDGARKRPVPFLPGRIGVITSPTGAVIRDILNITARRFPSIPVLIAPVRVQGTEAAAEIVEALSRMNEVPDVDVIILARGGGSLEDLAPFNDESVVRAVCGSRVPVISAVGHETDFTITDFAADLRAPTPSAAAELVCPRRKDLCESIFDLRRRLQTSLARNLDRIRTDVGDLSGRLKHPGRRIADLRQRLDAATERLRTATANSMEAHRRNALDFRNRLNYPSLVEKIKNHRLEIEAARKDLVRTIEQRLDGWKAELGAEMALLENMSPLAVLRRGYSIVRTYPDGRIVRRAQEVSPGDPVEIKLSSGQLKAQIREILQR